jgi:hypothetical protein
MGAYDKLHENQIDSDLILNVYQRILETASSILSTAIISIPGIDCLGLLALGMMAEVNPSLAASFRRSCPR